MTIFVLNGLLSIELNQSKLNIPYTNVTICRKISSKTITNLNIVNKGFGDTGRARLILNDSSARFSFELSGNSIYVIPCNSNYVQNFELEINSI